MLTAVLAYLAATALVLQLQDRLLRATAHVPVTNWLTERIYLPMLRYGAVLVLLLAGHPQIYGIEQAPPVTQLLAAGHDRLTFLLNLSLVLSLLLPLAPALNRLPSVVLTTQGILSACVLFGWTAPALGLEHPRLWMGWKVVGAALVLNLMAYLMGRAMTANFPLGSRTRLSNLLMEALRMAAELPAILIYTLALGAQLGT